MELHGTAFEPSVSSLSNKEFLKQYATKRPENYEKYYSSQEALDLCKTFNICDTFTFTECRDALVAIREIKYCQYIHVLYILFIFYAVLIHFTVVPRAEYFGAGRIRVFFCFLWVVFVHIRYGNTYTQPIQPSDNNLSGGLLGVRLCISRRNH